MTDIQAAVGREQLKRLPDIVAARRSLAERYRTLLSDVRGLRLPARARRGPAATGRATASGCPTAATSGTVMQAMLDRGIATRRGVMCTPPRAELRGERDAAACRTRRRRRITASSCRCIGQMTRQEQEQVADGAAARVRRASECERGTHDLHRHPGLQRSPRTCRCSTSASAPPWNRWGSTGNGSSWTTTPRTTTFAVVSRLAERDRRVRGVRFARNFGAHTAATCGLHEARGDCVDGPGRGPPGPPGGDSAAARAVAGGRQGRVGGARRPPGREGDDDRVLARLLLADAAAGRT